MTAAVVDRTAVLVAEPAQHARNVTFARGYSGRPSARIDENRRRPRVLISGFGRFPPHETNATAAIVCRLAGSEPPRIPRTDGALAPHQVDDPAAHVRVLDCALTLPRAGVVDARIVVLPVFWDLAAVVALREIEAFAPDVVMMNGIGRDVQPIVVEAGAINRQAARPDASSRVVSSGGEIVLGGAAVRMGSFAADEVVAAMRSASVSRGLDAVAPGVERGEPRQDNAYLCNQLAYLVDHVLAHPDRTLQLLRAHDDDPGVALSMQRDLRETKRMFVHWPALLAEEHLDAATTLVCEALDAQLLCLSPSPRASISAAMEGGLARGRRRDKTR